MNFHFESRFAVSPKEAKQMNTEELRGNFLIDNLFTPNEVKIVLSHYDRFITAGAMPIGQKIALPNPENLKANYLLKAPLTGLPIQTCGAFNFNRSAIVAAVSNVIMLSVNSLFF